MHPAFNVTVTDHMVQVVRCLLLVREVRGLNPEPFKSSRCQYCNFEAWALCEAA